MAKQALTNTGSDRPKVVKQACLFGHQDHTNLQPRDHSIYTQPLSLKERRAQLDITRERGARRRIFENWERIEMEYGHKIDARRVLRVLNRDLDEKRPALKTVQNHLSQLRSEGLIP